MAIGDSTLTKTGNAYYAPSIVGGRSYYFANDTSVATDTAATNYLTGAYNQNSAVTVSVWLNFSRFKCSKYIFPLLKKTFMYLVITFYSPFHLQY